MNKKRSELELLMRKLGEMFQFGFQFYCGTTINYSKFGRQSWWVRIWDLREGHWHYHNGHPHEQDHPGIHWYPKIRSDYCFDIEEQYFDNKDKFIIWLLFGKGKLFERIGKDIPGMPSSIEECFMKNQIVSRHRLITDQKIIEEYNKLKEKYGH